MSTRELALSVLAFLDVPADDFVRIAADSGFDSVSLRVGGSKAANPSELRDPGQLACTARRLAETGLGVIDAEVLRLGPDLEASEIERVIDAASSLGARHLLTVNEGWRNQSELVEQLARVRALAEPAALRPCLEFMAFSGCRTLDDAVETAVASGTAVLVDALHLFRSGGGPAQLRAAVERHGTDLFPYIQLCDAPFASPPRAGLRDEAVARRLLPGDGELPLPEVLGALPAMTPVAVEAPTSELGALSPRERAENTMRATRQTLVGADAQNREDGIDD